MRRVLEFRADLRSTGPYQKWCNFRIAGNSPGTTSKTRKTSRKPTYRYRSEVEEILSWPPSRHPYILEQSTSSCSGSEPDDGPTLSIRSPLGIIHFCSLVDQY